MRLVDLDPRWLTKDGVKVGFVFVSPADPTWRQCCVFGKFTFREQCALLRDVGMTYADEGWPKNVQTCKTDCAWTWVSGDSFENISVTPSLDGSAGGLWHGFVTDGAIV